MFYILKTQFRLTYGAAIIIPKATVDLDSNVLEIRCILLLQHSLLYFSPSLPYCVIVSADFIEVSHLFQMFLCN